MRVLQINQVVRVTSTGRIVEGLGNFLIENGHESFIAYSGRPSQRSNSVLYQVSNPIDTYLHAIGTRLFDRHGLYSKRVSKKFIKWIDSTYPDIIHLHNIHGYYLNYPVLFDYLKNLNKPVFWTFHDFWPITGHCSHFINVGCTKWKTQCYNCPKLRYYPASYLSDNSRENFLLKKQYFQGLKKLTIISISSWVKNILRDSILGEYPIKAIPNGVNSKTFLPIEKNANLQVKKKYNLPSKKLLIALATTWQEGKGYYDYLKLSKVLPLEYQIVLVGLQGKMAQGLPDNITAIPKTSNVNELVQLYNLSEINLNLSYQETFGLTTVEALMCGVPSIVYNSTASPELVTKETGIVVEPGDIASVFQGILEIAVNGGKKAYSKHCREHAVSKFDENKVYGKHLKLYEEAL